MSHLYIVHLKRNQYKLVYQLYLNKNEIKKSTPEKKWGKENLQMNVF